MKNGGNNAAWNAYRGLSIGADILDGVLAVSDSRRGINLQRASRKRQQEKKNEEAFSSSSSSFSSSSHSNCLSRVFFLSFSGTWRLDAEGRLRAMGRWEPREVVEMPEMTRRKVVGGTALLRVA